MTESPLRSLLEDELVWQIEKTTALPRPEREYRFAPPRRWRFDLAWPALKVAVEVEGGSWVGGRHSRPGGFEKDAEKYNEAVIAGWRVLRVTGAMVSDGRALASVERLLAPQSDLASGHDAEHDFYGNSSLRPEDFQPEP